MRILVLDGNQNQAVASVRSLADAGHEVLVGARDPGRGEELSKVAANSAGSAGDKRHLTREIEARQLGHGLILLARSRSSNFWILPVEVFGSGPKTTMRGTL